MANVYGNSLNSQRAVAKGAPPAPVQQYNPACRHIHEIGKEWCHELEGEYADDCEVRGLRPLPDATMLEPT